MCPPPERTGSSSTPVSSWEARCIFVESGSRKAESRSSSGSCRTKPRR
jgi:hypothetical protein